MSRSACWGITHRRPHVVLLLLFLSSSWWLGAQSLGSMAGVLKKSLRRANTQTKTVQETKLADYRGLGSYKCIAMKVMVPSSERMTINITYPVREIAELTYYLQNEHYVSHPPPTPPPRPSLQDFLKTSGSPSLGSSIQWHPACSAVQDQTPGLPFLVRVYKGRPKTFAINRRVSYASYDQVYVSNVYEEVHRIIKDRPLSEPVGAVFTQWFEDTHPPSDHTPGTPEDTPAEEPGDPFVPSSIQDYRDSRRALQYYKMGEEDCNHFLEDRKEDRDAQIQKIVSDENTLQNQIAFKTSTCQRPEELYVVMFSCAYLDPDFPLQFDFPILATSSSDYITCKESVNNKYVTISAAVLILIASISFIFVLFLLIPAVLRGLRPAVLWVVGRRQDGKEKKGWFPSSLLRCFGPVIRLRKTLLYSLTAVSTGYGRSRPLVVFMVAATALHICTLVWGPPIDAGDQEVLKWFFSPTRSGLVGGGPEGKAVDQLLFFVQVLGLSMFYGLITYLAMLFSFNHISSPVYRSQKLISLMAIYMVNVMQIMYFVNEGFNAKYWKYKVPYGYLFIVNAVDLLLADVFFVRLFISDHMTAKASTKVKGRESPGSGHMVIPVSHESVPAVTDKGAPDQALQIKSRSIRSAAEVQGAEKGPIATLVTQAYRIIVDSFKETSTFRYSPWLLVNVLVAGQMVTFHYLQATVRMGVFEQCLITLDSSCLNTSGPLSHLSVKFNSTSVNTTLEAMKSMEDMVTELQLTYREEGDDFLTAVNANLQQINTDDVRSIASIPVFSEADVAGIMMLADTLDALKGGLPITQGHLDRFSDVADDIMTDFSIVRSKMEEANLPTRAYEVELWLRHAGEAFRTARHLGFSMSLVFCFFSLVTMMAAYKRTITEYRQKHLATTLLKCIKRSRMKVRPARETKTEKLQAGTETTSSEFQISTMVLDKPTTSHTDAVCGACTGQDFGPSCYQEAVAGTQDVDPDSEVLFALRMKEAGSQMAQRMEAVTLGPAIYLLGVMLSTVWLQLYIIGFFLTVGLTFVFHPWFWSQAMGEHKIYLFLIVVICIILLNAVVVTGFFGDSIFSDGQKIRKPAGWLAFYTIMSLTFLIMGILIAAIRVIVLLVTTILFSLSKLESSIFSSLFVGMDRSHICFLAEVKMEQAMAKYGSRKFTPGPKGRAFRRWKLIRKTVLKSGARGLVGEGTCNLSVERGTGHGDEEREGGQCGRGQAEA